MAQQEPHKRRILVVDDNIDYAELVCTLLEMLPCHVEVAHSGKTALEKAQVFHPEIVLCDLALDSDMDGYSVARAFRKDPKLKNAKLIALTGFSGEEFKISAKNAGFDEQITKSGDLDVMLHAFQSLNS